MKVTVYYTEKLAQMLKQKNTKTQGDVGLGASIAWATSHGYVVNLPLNDNQAYDLIIDIDGVLHRTQVKTTTYVRGGSYQVQLKTCGGNRSGHNIKKFDNTLVDAVFVLTEEGKRYFIPSKHIQATTMINLGAKFAQFDVDML